MKTRWQARLGLLGAIWSLLAVGCAQKRRAIPATAVATASVSQPTQSPAEAAASAAESHSGLLSLAQRAELRDAAELRRLRATASGNSLSCSAFRALGLAEGRGRRQAVLHRQAGFGFSLTDDVSRRARAKACKNSGTSPVVRRAGALDEDETARRAVCQLADGGDPEMIERALAEACSRNYELPTDCKKRRPGVCFWRAKLLGLPAAFAALQPWLNVSAAHDH